MSENRIEWHSSQNELAKTHLNLITNPENLVLRKKCDLLTEEELKTGYLSTGESIVGILSEMARILMSTKGLGLAAPQVGISKRFFIMVLSDLEEIQGVPYNNVVAFINPKIISKGGIASKDEEGCLSLPDVFVPISRSTEISVTNSCKFYFEDTKITISTHLDSLDDIIKEKPNRLCNLDARVFQHELDHLDGILITDRMSKKDKLRFNERI